jgi:hypothetical protein
MRTVAHFRQIRRARNFLGSVPGWLAGRSWRRAVGQRGRHKTSVCFNVRYNGMKARVAELADALDLGSSVARRGGSSPPSRTPHPVLHLLLLTSAFCLLQSSLLPRPERVYHNCGRAKGRGSLPKLRRQAARKFISQDRTQPPSLTQIPWLPQSPRLSPWTERIVRKFVLLACDKPASRAYN